MDPTGTVGTPVITDLSFTVIVNGISEDNVTVELLSSTGTQLVTSGDLGTTRTYTISHSESTSGTYSYTVRLTDAAGNTTDYAVSGVVLFIYETLDFTAEGMGALSITGNLTSTVTMYKLTGDNDWNGGARMTTGFTAPVTVEFDKTAFATPDLASLAMISWDAENTNQYGSFTQLDWAAYPVGTTSRWDVYHNSTHVQASSVSWSSADKKYLVYGTDGTIKHYSGSTLMYETAAAAAGTATRYLRTSFYAQNSGNGAFSNIRVCKQIWNGSSYV